MSDNWYRLEKIVKWTGLSVNAFAINIGLKRSENLYQIKKGNNRISPDLAELITKKYSVISRGWLLTGEGDMFCEPTPEIDNGIPFYSMDVIEAEKNINQQAPVEEPRFNINIPIFTGCDFAALSLTPAMEPEIPAGAIVILKKYEVKNLIPGESFLIITPHFKGIRIIRKGVEASEIMLCAKNTTNYDPIVINIEDIQSLYIIKGIIVNNNV